MLLSLLAADHASLKGKQVTPGDTSYIRHTQQAGTFEAAILVDITYC
jgi:hypothetical protein